MLTMQSGYHEWPVHDRRQRRSVELVVPMNADCGSVVFAAGSRPWRILPLTALAVIGILSFVGGTSSVFAAAQGMPVRAEAAIGQS